MSRPISRASQGGDSSASAWEELGKLWSGLLPKYVKNHNEEFSKKNDLDSKLDNKRRAIAFSRYLSTSLSVLGILIVLGKDWPRPVKQQPPTPSPASTPALAPEASPAPSPSPAQARKRRPLRVQPPNGRDQDCVPILPLGYLRIFQEKLSVSARNGFVIRGNPEASASHRTAARHCGEDAGRD
jgi:hypothetical protein